MSFEKPENQYRSAPFWSLNGKLEREELRRQIGTLKEMGFGGAFVHSRNGLDTEYMSEEWLDLVSFCADELEREGMDAWLYDEDRWPSGTCGGYVTREPRYRLKFLSLRLMSGEEYARRDFGGALVGAYVLKLSGEPFPPLPGLDPRAGMRIESFEKLTGSAPGDALVAAVCVEEQAPESFYNGFTYADTMNPEATREFLNLTHEKYSAAFGDKFGKSVKGIFTDEPHRGALLSGFSVSNENRLGMLPWTYALFSRYEARWGEKLEEELPLLWFRTAEHNFSRTMWQYVEVLQELFLESFAEPCAEWCRAHGLTLTGHVLHEDTLSAQTTMCGSVMRYYETMDIPGMDNLTRADTVLCVPIQVASVARQCGKPRALTELYGVSGWQGTFADYKQIGDWQAALGMDFRCPHLSWYTMKGEAKRDYPASFLGQAGWYREYRYVEDYFARLAEVFSGAEAEISTLVVSPVESAWGLSHMGTYDLFAVRDADYRRLEEDYAGATAALLGSGVEFDFGDEEMMSRLCRVNGNVLEFGGARYREVVLPGMVNLRASTLALLRAFAEAGGRVVIAGRAPSYVEGRPAAPDFGFAERCGIEDLGNFVGKTRGFFARAEVEERTCRVGARTLPAMLSAVRRKDGDYFCFFVNLDREKGRKACLRFPGEWNAEKWNLRTGEKEGLPARTQGTETVCEYSFAESEELLIRLTKGEIRPMSAPAKGEYISVPDLAVRYELNEDNYLVLDRPACYADGVFLGKDEILKADRKLRSRYGLPFRGGMMVQPWYRHKFGESAAPKVCDLTLEYEFDVREIPKAVSLMLESPEQFRAELNGAPLSFAAHTAAGIDRCFRLVPLPRLKRGRNVLRLFCAFSADLDLEAFYLRGAFGVRVGTPCEIIALPETLRFGDIGAQGLPFYTGKVTYFLPAEEGEYDLRLTDFCAACLKVGEEIVAFPPYEANGVRSGEKGLPVTAVLGRKNLFGPLHELPVSPPGCGPDSFLTEGEAFSEDYALLKQGIFAPPMLRRR